MEGVNSEQMSAQAQQIWSMLDDMAENNPAAYQNFIQRQIKEGKEFMAPPEPHMCVQVTILRKPPSPLFVNFCGWPRVPEPKTPEDPVPVVGCPISQENDERGAFSLTSVAFHPKVLEEYGREAKNPADADTLVQLALDYIEHEQKVKVTRSYTVLPIDTPYKGDLESLQHSLKKKLQKQDDQLEKDFSELEKTFGPIASDERESLMSKLSNLATDTSTNGKPGGVKMPLGGARNKGSDSITIPGLSDQQPVKSGLIQEIGCSPVQPNSKLPSPKYSLEPADFVEGRCLCLKVELPGVKSVAECELDISEDDVCLLVPGQYELKVKLPSCIHDDDASAKFIKKSSTLTVTMPVKT